MQAEFGNLYIQRYWNIDDDLLLALKGSEKHRRHGRRYLRLFEDEFDVASLGFWTSDSGVRGIRFSTATRPWFTSRTI